MKVLIVDDDQLVTMSLKTILSAQEDIEVVAIGHSGKEAMSLFTSYQPDILLMDIRMGEMTGIEAASQIISKFSQANILFLTTFLDNEYVIQALKIGAKGYLLKQDFESIAPSLRAVQSGQAVFGDRIMEMLPDLLNEKTASDMFTEGFTQREEEVLKEIAEGKNNKEIAEQLFLSEGTVRNYVSGMLDKLNLRDRTQLAIYYYKRK